MKIYYYQLRKNGPYFNCFYIKSFDLSKPKLWIEGFEYKFNEQTIFEKNFKSDLTLREIIDLNYDEIQSIVNSNRNMK